MAWFAEVDSAASVSPSGYLIQPINYYDDAILDGNNNPSLVFSWIFTLQPGTTLASLQDAVISQGQAARKLKQVASTLNAAAPVGTKITIP